MAEASLPYTLHPYANCTNLNYMVRIEVGASFDKNTSKFFTVPSGLLTRRSISFKERLSKVPNVEVNVLSLPNYDPNTFELYLRLVYNNQVPNIPGPLPYDIIRKEQVRFAKLYVLCWKLQDVHGKNCALQALRESIYRMLGTDNWTSPGFSVVGTIYSGTVPGAQARDRCYNFSSLLSHALDCCRNRISKWW